MKCVNDHCPFNSAEANDGCLIIPEDIADNMDGECPKKIVAIKAEVPAFDDLFNCRCKNKYSIEPHGKGHAIYWGRCNHKHGSNIAFLSECVREDIIRYFEASLNRQDNQPLHNKIAKLEAKLSDWEETHRRIIDEPCREDEKHCTCVPALRREVQALQDDKERLDWLLKFCDVHVGRGSLLVCLIMSREAIDAARK